MKDWGWWLLMMGGLVAAFVLWPFKQSVDQVSHGAVASQDTRAVPYRKPELLAKAPAPRSRFGGYPCPSSDCSEDKAGFRWAEDNAIVDPDDCTGNSGAFIEGCRVYAQQRGLRP